MMKTLFQLALAGIFLGCAACRSAQETTRAADWMDLSNLLPPQESTGDGVYIKAIVSISEWRGAEVVKLHTPTAPYEFFSVWSDAPLDNVRSRVDANGSQLAVQFVGEVRRFSAEHTTHPLRDPAYVIYARGNEVTFLRVEDARFPDLGVLPKK